MSDNKQSSKETAYTGRGLSLGLVFGTSLGIILWLATDNIVFFPVFVGAGISIGLSIGSMRDKKEIQGPHLRTSPVFMLHPPSIVALWTGRLMG